MPVSADCTLNPAPVHGVVVFEAAEFRSMYPQFAANPPTDLTLGQYFTIATIIVALGSREVASLDDLLSALEQHQPGETITVTVARGGKRVDLPVRLGLGN